MAVKEKVTNIDERLRGTGEVVKRNNEMAIDSGDSEIAMNAKRTGAKLVYIYDTITGERSMCLDYMVRQKVNQTRPDGSFIFTTVNPQIPLKRGTIKCHLHPDSPNRLVYDEMGLPVCRKANITNEYQLKQHMKKRHPSAWEAIESDRKEADDLEMKNLYKKLIESNKK